MAHPSPDVSGALAEFVALRSEMELRAKHQNQIVALQIATTGGVFGYVLSRAGLLPLLLIVPASSYLLCGRYAAQHTAIMRMSTYIRKELSPRVPGGLGWEQWIGARPRSGRFLGWFLPFVLAFPGASVAALAWTFETVEPLRFHYSLHLGAIATIWWVGVIITFVSLYLLLRVFLRRRLGTRDSVSPTV